MDPTPEQEDLNTPMIAVAGVIGAVVVFLGIVALQAWYYNVEKEEVYRKVVAPAAEELSSVTAEQQGQLNSYRVIDGRRQVAAIPIDRAMGSVVQDLASGRNPLPVPPAPPAPASQPTTTTSPTSTSQPAISGPATTSRPVIATQPGRTSHER